MGGEAPGRAAAVPQAVDRGDRPRRRDPAAGRVRRGRTSRASSPWSSARLGAGTCRASGRSRRCSATRARNDVTARDQQRNDGQWTRAKGHDSFCPLGPWIETVLDPSDLRPAHRAGRRGQAGLAAPRCCCTTWPRWSRTSRTCMTLLPGDVILTGTPAGVGPMTAGRPCRVTDRGHRHARPTRWSGAMTLSRYRDVRFAARRPTGDLHVGNVRTALFNWAFARHTGGTFVLPHRGHRRRARHRGVLPRRARRRCAGSAWTGTRDPRSAARTAPYRQSERLDIYRDVARRLLEAGLRLRVVLHRRGGRGAAPGRGRRPEAGYDNSDRDLTDEQEAAFRAEGRDAGASGSGCPTSRSCSPTWSAARSRSSPGTCRTSCSPAPTAARSTRSPTPSTTR